MRDASGWQAIQAEIGYASTLVSRLERLSVDSYWAHRSSGLRGALLRALERAESLTGGAGPEQVEAETRSLRELISQGADLLEKAARDIRADERGS